MLVMGLQMYIIYITRTRVSVPQFLHHMMNYRQEKQNTRVLVCPKVRVPSLVFLIPPPGPIFLWHEQPLTEDKTTHL